MATTKKATGKTATKKKADHEVPSAVRDDKNPGDLLGALAASGGAKKKKKPGKTARPEMVLSPEVEQEYAEWVPADTLAKHFSEHAEALKDGVKTDVFDNYVGTMWDKKAKPTNPSLKTKNEDGKPDCEGMFVVQERFKVQGDSEEEIAELLTNGGLEQDDADNLVEAEIDLKPLTGIRNFRELVEGHYEGKEFIEASDEEQAAGQHLMQVLMSDEFTDEERAILVQNTPQIKVKKGFLERATGYAHSKEQLAAIFAVIQPVLVMRGAKFGISDSLDERNSRLIQIAAEILGTELGVDEDD